MSWGSEWTKSLVAQMDLKVLLQSCDYDVSGESGRGVVGSLRSVVERGVSFDLVAR